MSNFIWFVEDLWGLIFYTMVGYRHGVDFRFYGMGCMDANTLFLKGAPMFRRRFVPRKYWAVYDRGFMNTLHGHLDMRNAHENA